MSLRLARCGRRWGRATRRGFARKPVRVGVRLRALARCAAARGFCAIPLLGTHHIQSHKAYLIAPPSTGPDIGKVAKRKHQLTSLYQQSKAQELEQLEKVHVGLQTDWVIGFDVNFQNAIPQGVIADARAASASVHRRKFVDNESWAPSQCPLCPLCHLQNAMGARNKTETKRKYGWA